LHPTESATLDHTLIGIENHEAVVDAALKESRQALVRAKVRLAKLEKESSNLNNYITELGTEIELWQDRAKACAEDDRPKAIECLQRKNQRVRSLKLAKQQLAEQTQVSNQVRSTVEDAASKVQALQAQRNQMRSREAAAQAGAITNALDNHMADDVDSAMERWEVKVGQVEILNETQFEPLTNHDPLAASFSATETGQALEAELDELMHQGEKNE